MLILADQDVYKLTIDKLKEWGHDVAKVRELGMQRASDEDLLKMATEANRLFVTRDKDFGALIFLKEKASLGVILLRGTPKTVGEIHRQLQRLIQEHSEDIAKMN